MRKKMTKRRGECKNDRKKTNDRKRRKEIGNIYRKRVNEREQAV